MSYEKQNWVSYDDNKTEEQNIQDGAVVTAERMNHVESGLADHVNSKENPHGVTAHQVGALTEEETYANVIYQLIGKEKVRITFKADFINKLAGSLIENVNISKRSSAGNGSPIRLLSLEEFGIEVNQGGYDLFSQLDSKLYNLQATNSGGIIQEVFSYNVVEIVKHELGEQFFIDRGASKVSEQSQVIREIAVDDRANIWAYGSGASGNKVTVGIWSYRSSNWQGLLSHSKNVITKVSRPTGNLKDYLGDDGFMNYITFAEASDGTTPSSINVDYSNFELTIEVSANEHIKSMIAQYSGENIDKKFVGLGNVDNYGTATQTEAESGTSTNKFMTPLRTKQQVTSRIASQTEAETGVSAEKIMTPLRTKQHVTSRIATQAEVDAGIRDDVMISPKMLKNVLDNLLPFKEYFKAGKAVENQTNVEYIAIPLGVSAGTSLNGDSKRPYTVNSNGTLTTLREVTVKVTLTMKFVIGSTTPIPNFMYAYIGDPNNIPAEWAPDDLEVTSVGSTRATNGQLNYNWITSGDLSLTLPKGFVISPTLRLNSASAFRWVQVKSLTIEEITPPK
ncbi:hypothetical protein [Enterococcus gilvus]|uniref:hypothetical protein n=1 Tax=Enterococcus gilvus TaxID=160453 RepID=UPI001C8CE118|nr:hypothetical protein [Enterococcus gilvus]MBX8939198.1 hypothetical protein [Enterococcus gilvus]